METKEYTIINATISEEEYEAIRTTETLISKILELMDKTDVYNMTARKFFDCETMTDALDFIRYNFDLTEDSLDNFPKA